MSKREKSPNAKSKLTIFNYQQKYPSLKTILTHNLHRSDTPHQLLQQRRVTVRELADALSDKLLLVHREAVAVPTLQQTAGHKSRRSSILGKLSE